MPYPRGRMSKKVFWSKLDKISCESDAIIPGVTTFGNWRPKRPPRSKGTGRKLQEVKAKIPIKQPVVVENLSPETTHTLNDISSSLEEISQRQMKGRPPGHPASLKDLCAEDKKRVANLIKELAKMGDEKEKVTDQLKEEREHFERQMLQLVQQQEQILHEREDIQARYFQCQELLAQYKEQILDTDDNESNASPREQKRNWKEQPRVHSLDVAMHDDLETRTPRLRQEQNKENIYQERKSQKVSELEKARKNVQRPYTSMIDKEIAQTKYSCPEGLSTIVAETSTPRDHVLYDDRVPILRPFREPIMSSTQKSLDIQRELNEFQPLEPDPSPRSSMQDSSPRGRGTSRVGFKEKLEFNDIDLQKHSPNIDSGGSVGDQEYVVKYKKLNSAERKKELLKQREILLKEQEKLKQILIQQENALRNKQNQLQKKQESQKARLDNFEQNSHFQKDSDNAKDEDDGSVFHGKVERLNFDKNLSDDEFKPVSDDDDNLHESQGMQHKNKGDRKDYATTATSPIPTVRPPYHSMATSPIRLDSAHTPSGQGPSYTDVATSVSHVQGLDTLSADLQNISTSAAHKKPQSPQSLRMTDFSEDSRQNNLPFQSNRQRSKNNVPRTPGDKTLSVVEIVNSLEESPSWKGSPYRTKISPDSPPLSGFSPARVGGTATIYSTTPERGSVMYGLERSKDRFDENEAEETAEESEILDDIFFS